MAWWNPSTPETITPTPWLHPAATMYLESLLRRDMMVIEHGCGGSTLWFASRVKEVHSYEVNEAWFRAVVNKVKARENVFVHLQHAPPLFPDMQCDLLFIDGWNGDRPEWILAASQMVVPGGVVVVDNANRPMYGIPLQKLAEHCTMPTVITAWTPQGKQIDTVFYRMKGGAEWI